MTQAFVHNLIHTCTIQRNAPTTSPSGELIPSWADLSTGVTCRYIHRMRTFAAEALTSEQLRSDLVLLLPTQDVQEGDRITDIVDADDTSVEAGPLLVTSVLTRRARSARHKSVQVEAID